MEMYDLQAYEVIYEPLLETRVSPLGTQLLFPLPLLPECQEENIAAE